MEEDVEAMEEDEEEGEIDFGGVEDVRRRRRTCLERAQEGEDTEDEDENEQDAGAAAVKGLGFSVETFGPLFWSQVDSILCNLHTNTHVLFRPPTDGLMAGAAPRHPRPWRRSGASSEQEDLGEGDRGLQGEYSVEGALHPGSCGIRRRGLHPRRQRNRRWRPSSGL